MRLEMAWDQRLARRVARPLCRWGVHPNAVTAVGLLLGLGAGVLFALGPGITADLGAAVFILAVLADHLDGEVARLGGKTTRFGHYFDHVAMATTYVSLFLGAGIGYRAGVLGPWAPLLGAAAGIAVALIMLLRGRHEESHGRESVKQQNLLGFEPEDTLYLVGPLTWLGGMPPFLAAAGVGAPVFLAFVAWQLYRRPAPGAGQGPRP